MASSRDLGDVIAVERLRRAMRDAERLRLAEAAAALAEAERIAAARSDDLAQAVANWSETLARPKPDPGIFGLAGAGVLGSEADHKAAMLDGKIALQRCQEAEGSLARAEARREGAGMIRAAIQRERERGREAQAAREAEDAFLWRRT